MKRLFALRHHLLLLGILGVVSLCAASTLVVPTAHAAECGELTTSVIDCGSVKDQTGSPVIAFLVLGIQILTGAVGVVAIGALVYAGMMYSSASGDTGQITKAKEIIRNTIIGLILFGTIALLLNFLIPGGLFDGNTKFGAGGNGLGKLTPTKVAQPLRVIEEEDDDTTSDDPDAAPVDPKNNNSSTLSNLRISSWNVKKYGGNSHIVSGVKILVKETDVLGMQETQGAVPSIRSALSKSDYGIYPTNKKDPRKVAVVWNKKKLSVLDKGHFNGAKQPSENLQREFVWIKFKEKTSGKVFYVINTHFPHNSNTRKNGDWYYTDTGDGRAWARHMQALTKWIDKTKKQGLPIFTTGDYNFDYRKDNCKQEWTPCLALSKKRDVKSGWELTKLADVKNKGSIKASAALIDYVFAWDRSYLTYRAMEVTHGGSKGSFGWNGSDHKPIRLSVTIGAQ